MIGSHPDIRRFYSSLLSLPYYHKWRLPETKMYFHHFCDAIIAVVVTRLENWEIMNEEEKFPGLFFKKVSQGKLIEIIWYSEITHAL